MRWSSELAQDRRPHRERSGAYMLGVARGWDAEGATNDGTLPQRERHGAGLSSTIDKSHRTHSRWASLAAVRNSTSVGDFSSQQGAFAPNHRAAHPRVVSGSNPRKRRRRDARQRSLSFHKAHSNLHYERKTHRSALGFDVERRSCCLCWQRQSLWRPTYSLQPSGTDEFTWLVRKHVNVEWPLSGQGGRLGREHTLAPIARRSAGVRRVRKQRDCEVKVAQQEAIGAIQLHGRLVRRYALIQRISALERFRLLGRR